jgi:hypothetical protein
MFMLWGTFTELGRTNVIVPVLKKDLENLYKLIQIP